MMDDEGFTLILVMSLSLGVVLLLMVFFPPQHGPGEVEAPAKSIPSLHTLNLACNDIARDDFPVPEAEVAVNYMLRAMADERSFPARAVITLNCAPAN